MSATTWHDILFSAFVSSLVAAAVYFFVLRQRNTQSNSSRHYQTSTTSEKKERVSTRTPRRSDCGLLGPLTTSESKPARLRRSDCGLLGPLISADKDTKRLLNRLKQAAELHDEKLIKQPPPAEDCPICMLLLPSLDTGHEYKSCCGKLLCRG